MSIDLRRGIEIHQVGEQTREWSVFGDQSPVLQSFGIAMAGVSDATEGFQFVRHNWDGAQVMVCTSGEGEVSLRNQWTPCTKGMAYLAPQGRPHAYRTVPGKHWNVCWVIYGPDHTFSPLQHLDAPRLVQADPRFLRPAVLGLYHELMGGCELAHLDAWGQLVHLYACRIAHPLNENDQLWKVWEMVGRDLVRKWTLQDLAALAMVSPETLRRLCLKYVGRSPMEHVTFIRITRAAALLSSTQGKLDTVAKTIGYNDRFSFSTAFKRVMGISPARYRRQRGHIHKIAP